MRSPGLDEIRRSRCASATCQETCEYAAWLEAEIGGLHGEVARFKEVLEQSRHQIARANEMINRLCWGAASVVVGGAKNGPGR